MAQKDEYVNSDTSSGRSKELVNDPLQPIHHTNVATAKFRPILQIVKKSLMLFVDKVFYLLFLSKKRIMSNLK